MTDYLLLFIGTALVNNLVLAKFLGLCPLLGVSNKQETAWAMGLATGFVLTLACALSYLVDAWLLQPFDLAYLRIISFILVIAIVVQYLDLILAKQAPVLRNVLGIFLPLITTNCVVLGVALLNLQQSHNFLQAMIYGLGSAAGFMLVLMLFAGLRERINVSDVPAPFRGPSIALITAGLMAMAFMGFAGLTK